MGELGSGFMLATHDLEIRGTGELLGEAQSGQIEEVGFTVYAEMLARAVRAVKQGRLDDAPFGVSACEVDLGLPSLIPDDYVPDVHARLQLYKRIAEAPDESALGDLKAELIDRFGKLPPQAENLFALTSVKLAAQALGIVKLRAHARGITAEFGAENKVDTRKVIRLIQTQPKQWKLEGQSKLQHAANLEAADARATGAREFLAKLTA
jgi:transcription-repair coupling factor (superfamily II helicase)